MKCERKIGPFDCCSVVQGDCLELMKLLPDGCVDAVITDPPYGVGRKYDVHDDSPELYREFFIPRLMETRRVGRVVAFTNRSNVLKFITDWDWVAVWNKPYSAGARIGNSPILPHWEAIVLYGIYSLGCDRECFGDVVSFNPEPSPAKVQSGTTCEMSSPRNKIKVDAPNGSHPLPKPIRLFEHLVAKLTHESETILDPFLGSGTTAVAAKKLGRHFLGFEISEEYCRIARERVAIVEMQPNLFEPKPEQMTFG